MELTRLIVTRPDGTVVGEVDPTRLVDASVASEVNGEHSLTLTTLDEYAKGDRILWRDARGIWHEHVVNACDASHEGGETVYEHYCVWSLQYDLAQTFVTAMPGTGGTPATARGALEAALGGTERWGVGTVDVLSTGSASMWRVSGWDAIGTLVKVWGGEVDATIDVGLTGVVSRSVDLLAHVGTTDVTRRFDFGHDVSGIQRTVLDDRWTARVIPLGKGEETDAGGYGRKVTIESVNGGVLWLENAATVPLVRLPSGDGYEIPVQVVENGDIESPQALKEWALAHLDEWTTPRVSYELDVLQTTQAGTGAQGVSLGDEVYVVDRAFGGDGLALAARVVRVEESLVDPSQVTVTISNVRDGLGRQLGSLAGAVSSLSDAVAAQNEYQASAAYMAALIGRLNDEINATGGYTYITDGEGLRTYDRPVSDPLVGAEATKVVEVKGGTIRIADSRTSSGDWDWTNVFTADGINSQLVRAVQVEAGYIGDLAGSGNFWDLDTGEFRLASTASIGGRTVQDVLDDVDATITSVDVQYAQNQSATTAPTSGWSTTAPAWRDGWYIWQRTATTTPEGVDYSTPVMISGRDGTDGTSVTIKGSYDTYAQLVAAHPTGQDGDSYMVGADLYVWNGSAWEDVGQIQGPQGPAGTSVTVSSIQYGTSTSASTAPSSWTTTPPTSIAAGRWLWVRTNYSNGSTATTKSYVGTDGEDGTSVYVQSTSKVDGVTTIVLANTDGTTSTIRIADGEDGATGQRGPAGENGESSYVHVAWANSQDGTQDFSTTVSAGKSFLGVYTDEQEDDSTNPADYSWSRIEGPAGEDGVGIASIVEQYYLSTSSSTQSGGSWVTTPPAYVAGRYYWTRSVITWDDGTVTITSAVLSRGLNSANSAATQAKSEAEAAQSQLDVLDTQQGVFNKLTNNGALQGLYMQDGQLYVNGSYIHGGTIVAGGANNVNGIIQVKDASGNVISQMDKDGATIVGDVTMSRSSVLYADGGYPPIGSTANIGITQIDNPEMGCRLYSWAYPITSTSYRPINALGMSVHGTMNARGGDTIHIIPCGNKSIDNTITATGAGTHSTIATDGALTVVAGIEKSSVPALNLRRDNAQLTYGTGVGTYVSGNNTVEVNASGVKIDTADTVTIGRTYTSSATGATRINNFAATVDIGNGTSSATNVKGTLNVARKATIYSLDVTNFIASNVKSRVVSTDDYDRRMLYAYETAAPMFGDVGSARIGGDGLCYVAIDDVFAETARTDFGYQVFLQKCGDGDLWVSEKHPGHFVVEGTPGLPFDWEVKARQRNTDGLRLESYAISDGENNELAVAAGTADDAEHWYDDDDPLEAARAIEDLYEPYEDQFDRIYGEDLAA